ncbi:hypothetical protein, partial [Roseisolibacter sp. H3M3-2]|uniref:DUF6929 family protein n=1 Tax=Roseisolibacter sp. H3M3-2 TaxID=3031323 RepID=UPI0023DB88C2
PGVPLRFAAGADDAFDRPAHVRAGSGLAAVGARVAVVQDDAAFVALADPATGLADAVTLPADDDGRRRFEAARGNKQRKYDLEACLVLPAGRDARLLAFGSGSTPRRERVLLATFPGGAPDPVLTRDERRGALPVYGALRAHPAFAGRELNVEGAVPLGGRVRLFGRGNGAATGGGSDAPATSATCEVAVDALLAFLLDGAPLPPLLDGRRYRLGDLDGAPLHFTDAAALPDGRVLYAAAAEDTPNAYDDGEVAGSALGLLAPDGAARWAPLLGPDGAPFRGKVEGVLPRDAARPDDPPGAVRLWVVTDPDDVEAPSTLHAATLEQ